MKRLQRLGDSSTGTLKAMRKPLPIAMRRSLSSVKRGAFAAAAAICVMLSTGCRSAFVEATVSNQTDKPLLLVEVDYPSASFGTENLAPGAVYHYRFKVLGSGELKLIYTDTAEKEHTVQGPPLHEGAEGPLVVTITSGGVEWKTQGVRQR